MAVEKTTIQLMFSYEHAAYRYSDQCNRPRGVSKATETQYRKAANAVFKKIEGRNLTDKEFHQLCLQSHNTTPESGDSTNGS